MLHILEVKWKRNQNADMIYKDFYPFYASYANPMLYRGEKEQEEKFLLSIQSLTLQNLIAIRIIMPLFWKETVEKAGFDLKMPEGTNPVYRVLPEEMIEVVQSQDGKKLVYRKTLTDGDNSGDYNDYKYTGVKTISGIEVNLRGDDADKIHVAYFTAFDGTYSIGSSASMTVKEVTKLMEDWIALNTK